jgi:hypothetical protein
MERRFTLPELRVAQLPKPPAPVVSPAGFVLCPLGPLPGGPLADWLARQWLYLRAFEEAQAVVQPSLPERDLLAVWN